MIYTMKVKGDWVVDIVVVDDIEEYIKERLIRSVEAWKDMIVEVITENEHVPTKKGRKFKFKMMRENVNGDIEIYKFNIWYGDKGNNEVRVKFTIRGPVRPDKNEVKIFAQVTGKKYMLERYGIWGD